MARPAATAHRLLRDATRELHEEAERRLAPLLVGEAVTLASVRAALRALHGFHAPLEARLAAAGSRRSAPRPAGRPRWSGRHAPPSNRCRAGSPSWSRRRRERHQEQRGRARERLRPHLLRPRADPRAGRGAAARSAVRARRARPPHPAGERQRRALLPARPGRADRPPARRDSRRRAGRRGGRRRLRHRGERRGRAPGRARPPDGRRLHPRARTVRRGRRHRAQRRAAGRARPPLPGLRHPAPGARALPAELGAHHPGRPLPPRAASAAAPARRRRPARPHLRRPAQRLAHPPPLPRQHGRAGVDERLAAPPASQIELERRPRALRDLIDEALALARPLADAKRVAIVEHLEECTASVDRDRLYQVVSNIVGNAIKFTPEGGRITVETHCLPTEIHVAIADTGPGIPDHELHHVFDRCWQARPSTRAAHGSGLGLYIAKSIVEAHGGRIWASHSPGGGAQFTFSLPRP